jgi:hypothetical protein
MCLSKFVVGSEFGVVVRLVDGTVVGTVVGDDV